MADTSFLTSSWDDLEKVFGINGQTTAKTTGMNPTQAKAATNAATISNAGAITAIFGGITSAIGSYYQAKSAQYQEKSQASSLDFQANIDAINARQTELSAQSIQEQGKTQVEQYTMQAAQKQASDTVSTAARGVDLSSASAVEQRASNTLVKDIDVMSINANATRAAWAQRTQETNDDNEALLARTGASNLRASANTISPVFAATTSLLGSAASLASKWDYSRKAQLAVSGVS